ncbi:MAG TPA: hypothetical protein VFJ17_04415 [Mycobacteriales bacterium]|jgi:hypothetical protein|nr:hypothetical protein [Mycobacteriales bacterium]
MGITLFGFVLFLHISFVVVAFAMAGIVHAGLPAMASARDVSHMRPWAVLLHRLDPLFPVVALVLLGLGSWLVHLGAHTGDGFSFKDGWVITSIVTLVVIEGIAGALLAPTAKRLVAAIHEAPDGPPSAELRTAARDPKIWYPGHIATFGFLGIVFVMATKPAGGWAWLFPTVGAAVGIALARLQIARLEHSAHGGAVPAQRASTTPATAAEHV